ncbi:S9 family peptidase [Rurimicrobium arvi]|uniref:S9 family peptidase n=2 Tax=Rurimicrobium arvi TaxID=2049916 RepID=A0ABP8MTN9_9BACT
MTPELLWSLNRVSAGYVSPDGKRVLISSRRYDVSTEKGTTRNYFIPVTGGKKSSYNGAGDKNIFQQDAAVWYASDEQSLYRSTDEGNNWEKIGPSVPDADNMKVSPDGKYLAFSKSVLVKPTLGKDIYKDMSKTSAQIYTDLNYRHWDTWGNGTFSHLFVKPVGNDGTATDLLEGKQFDCPQKPHGGAEDFVWSPDSRKLLYVCKKQSGKAYAISTNTDIYAYTVSANTTVNLTEGIMGYDMNPLFSPDGRYLAFTSMKTDGFEADKNDVVVMDVATGYKRNMTAQWDETVGSLRWSESGNSIYFTAPWKGTEQLFEVQVPGNLMSRNLPVIDQVTNGNFDISGIVGETKNEIIVSRTDWNHAAEIFAVDKENGAMRQISHENDAVYSSIRMSKITKRFIKTTDGKEEFAWVIYPPDFNPAKKYPTLLYCQGGPQGALSQFYSFRWNFQLMAAQGYIVIAPNRRGMPGWGVKWNADISKDWGGQPMDDYLSAIDDISREPYVDKNRLGCVGASYGGYSVFMLAGIHNNRFKTFISHCGLFDLKSWYGTTEELWFANWDIGGDYWSGKAAKSYNKFSPSNYVQNWNTPIMVIQGGKDFRVPIEQGQQAFQAAQLKGLKSKFLYFPDENHWIMRAQNAIVWQREFFGWLKETL